MPTLRQIWRDVVPTATWLSPEDGADRAAAPGGPDPEIGWVRVLRARVPALEGLGPGDLAIVPEPALAALVAGGAEPAAVIAELVRAGVAALLLVGEGPPGPSVAALVAATRSQAIPALSLEGGEPAALERSLVGYLVNRRAELDRRAAQVDATVERLALEDRGLEALAGAIGASLGRAVAIEDERGVAVAVHAPEGNPDAAAAATRYLAQPRQAALRVRLPGVGTLALLGPQPVSELDRAVADRVAPLLALEMGREAARRARGGVPDALPSDGPPWVVVVARQIVRGEDVPAEERARRRDRLVRLAPARRLLLRGDVTSVDYRVVAAVGADDPRGVSLASRIAATVGRDVAVSRTFAEPEERSAAEAEARATLEAVEGLPDRSVGWSAAGTPPGGEAAPSVPRVVLAERIAAYRLLGELHNLPNGPRLAAALLAPLLVGSPAARRRRLATLRAVLDHPAGSSAAQALRVHRNTLQYRVDRLEALTGWHLDDPDLRLALAVAVRLVQNDQVD